MGRIDDYRILGIKVNSSTDEIKKAYRKICLKTHPDKLHNLSEEERINREDIFKTATESYKRLIDPNNEELILEDFDVFCENVFNFAAETFKSSLYKRKINVYVEYVDILNNIIRKCKIKLPLIGTRIIQIDCGKFPRVVEFIKHNDIEFEIQITMIIRNTNEQYYHIKNSDTSIDLIRVIKINHLQFYNGFNCSFKHLDRTHITLDVKPTRIGSIRLEGKGIVGGDLIVRFKLCNPTKKNLKYLNADEMTTFLNLLQKLYKDNLDY